MQSQRKFSWPLSSNAFPLIVVLLFSFQVKAADNRIIQEQLEQKVQESHK